jgi:hypothetical protein
VALTCPKCGTDRALEICASLELPADSRSDEISLQTLNCQMCGFLAAGVYEESHRGALDQECFTHYAPELDAGEFQELQELIQACPQPYNPCCECKSHAKLSRKDSAGRWAEPGFGNERNCLAV